MSSSRSGLPSRRITASMPCWRGSGPMSACCRAEMPSTTNSAKPPRSSGTPSAAYRAPARLRADLTITCSTSRTDELAGHGQHDGADPLEDLVLARGLRTGLTAHDPDGTRAGTRPRRPVVLGPLTRASPGCGPMCTARIVPSVESMNTDALSAPIAVVTGASRGLGYALADALAGAGYRLVIDGRDDDALQAAAASLASLARLAGDGHRR